ETWKMSNQANSSSQLQEVAHRARPPHRQRPTTPGARRPPEPISKPPCFQADQGEATAKSQARPRTPTDSIHQAPQELAPGSFPDLHFLCIARLPVCEPEHRFQISQAPPAVSPRQIPKPFCNPAAQRV